MTRTNTVTWITYSLLLSVLLYSCTASSGNAGNKAAPPPPVQVMTIDTANATTSKEYTASIEGKVNVEIRPQVEGTLDKVYIDEGAYVSKGQPLFKINDLPYREQVNNAMAGLHAAEAALTNAQLEVDKLTPLVQNKVISNVQLRSAQAAYKVAKANVAQAQANVATAQINLGYTTIKAPVSGYVGRLLKKTGALVGRTDPQALTVLSDVHEVYAYFSMGETDFIHFKSQYPGGKVEDKLRMVLPVSLVLADNTVYPEQGKIDMVDGQFDKQTGAITLRATFPNAAGLLRSGNTGKVRLSKMEAAAMIVPQEATIEMQDKVFVYALGDSNKVNKRPIVIAGKVGTNYIVQEGIQTGDRIAFKGLDHLQEGQVITPVPAKTDAKE